MFKPANSAPQAGLTARRNLIRASRALRLMRPSAVACAQIYNIVLYNMRPSAVACAQIYNIVLYNMRPSAVANIAYNII